MSLMDSSDKDELLCDSDHVSDVDFQLEEFDSESEKNNSEEDDTGRFFYFIVSYLTNHRIF